MIWILLAALFLSFIHQLISYDNLHAVVNCGRFLIICFLLILLILLVQFLFLNAILDDILYFCVNKKSFFEDRILLHHCLI